LVAAVVWRAVRAHGAASAGERLLGRIGRRPRLRVSLSLRLWAYSFAATSLWFLIQDDAMRLSTGRWPLLAPWLHTYALPVFAVCSLLLAVGWGAVRSWVADVERYTASTLERATRMLRAPASRLRRRFAGDERAPRRLHGIACESRPPASSAASPSESLSPGRSWPTWRPMQPPSEMVHWLFGMGILLLGLLTLAEVIVGREVWVRRAWRAYLWPGLAFGLGVAMWPVMTF